MSQPHHAPDGSPRAAATALAVTLALQIYASFAATATSVLAPEIGRDLGIAPSLVGVYVGLIFVGSMAGSLGSGGFIERYGSIRVSQVCVLLCAAGILSTLGTGAAADARAVAVALVVSPMVIGLGYGPITPASSHVLARTAPPGRMALTFSIKQTGVPAGAGLAGALLPVVALASGWKTTFALVVATGVVVALVAQPTRARLDADREGGRPLFPEHGLFTVLGEVLRTPSLAELAFVSFVYSAGQTSLQSFLVLYLTESLGFSLVAAGFALTVTNLGAMVGRIAWGAVADLYAAPRVLLGLIGATAALCAWVTASFDGGWPTAGVIGVCALYGATAIGWNGVQLSELARRAPAGRAGAITGAAGFIGFGGVVFGPPTFALISSLTGGYRAGFVFFGALSMAFALRLLSRRRAV